MSDEMDNALVMFLNRINYSLYSEEARQEGGLKAQKDFARRLLKMRAGTGVWRAETRVWLIEQGDDMNEVEKLGKGEEEVEVQDKDEVCELDTTEEYDWTSTSTLE